MTTEISLADLTAFQRGALVVIAKGDGLSGVQVTERLEALRPETIHHGRVYPNLNDLAEKGLVNKQAVNAREDSYTVSTRGRRELSEYVQWLIEDGGKEPVPNPI